MNEPMSTYEVLPMALRGYEHTAGETCEEGNLCVLCRSAKEIEYLYDEMKKHRSMHHLYEDLYVNAQRQADIWQEVARNVFSRYCESGIADYLSEDDIANIMTMEYDKILRGAK